MRYFDFKVVMFDKVGVEFFFQFRYLLEKSVNEVFSSSG